MNFLFYAYLHTLYVSGVCHICCSLLLSVVYIFMMDPDVTVTFKCAHDQPRHREKTKIILNLNIYVLLSAFISRSLSLKFSARLFHFP